MKSLADARGSMPTYQFRFHCKRCSEVIVLTMRVDAYDRSKRDGIECPRCHGVEVDRETAIFAVKRTRRRAAARARDVNGGRRPPASGRHGIEV